MYASMVVHLRILLKNYPSTGTRTDGLKQAYRLTAWASPFYTYLTKLVPSLTIRQSI